MEIRWKTGIGFTAVRPFCPPWRPTKDAAGSLENDMATDNGRDDGQKDGQIGNLDETPFWRRKSLLEMTDSEWESLCDGCGKCCLNKLEEEGTDRTFYTDVGCRLLDGQSCRCRDYPNRLETVEDCVRLTPESLKTITWLPPSCAYVRLAEGKDLYWWHPLVSGDPETVHSAGVSVRGRVGASETDVPDDALEDYIVSWPLKLPKAARTRR
jgi:uncharacterized cysteine cluster protein YcgN (CxxCxxCC family)